MKIKQLSLVLAVGVSTSVLTGCGIYNKYHAEDVDSNLVKEYAEALKQQDDSLAFGNLSWRAVFTDPTLADLIDRALANNKDLRNAKLNVDIAHANLKGAKLSYLPSLAFTPNGAGAKYADNDFSWTYQLPLSVNWEIDIFGKTLNTKRGAQMAELQTKYYEQAVRSQIIAGVAQCYYSIAALESQLKLSRETSALWKESVNVMRNLKEAGRLREDAVVQSLAQYYSIEASINDIELSLHEANNTLSLLMNEMPQKWTISPDATLNVPVMKRSAIPMAELAVRPDVRASEMALASAFYSTASARAAFYPSLNITANGGFTNLLGSFVKNPGDWFIQLAGSLTAPLFSRGQNIARLKAAKLQQEQSLNNFKYTLLSASAEINDALVSFANNTEKSKMLALQTEKLQQAVEYTNLLMAHDTSTTYLEVLNSQSSLLSAQMNSLNTELSRIQDLIKLYQALGGGR